MLIGWVRVHRTMMEKRNYLSEEFCRNMAWIDLVMIANYKDSNIRKRGVLVELKRGDVGYSLRELAKRWRWSIGKVNRFLNELETEGQIVTQKNNVTCCITIVNYDKYQSEQNAERNTDEITSETPNGTQTEHKRVRNKEGKELKELKERKELFIAAVFQIEGYPDSMKQEFVDHWTEANQKGSMKFEAEKFFEIPKRLATWKRNSEKFQERTNRQSKTNERALCV